MERNKRLLGNVQDWWEGGEQHTAIESWTGAACYFNRNGTFFKETWWWNNVVKDATGVKKDAKTKWETSGRQEERETSIGRQTRREGNK